MKTQEAQDTELQKSKVYKAALCERTSISERVRILGETACSVLAELLERGENFLLSSAGETCGDVLLQERHTGM